MKLRICVLSAFPEQFTKFCERTLSTTKALPNFDLIVCGNGWTAEQVSAAYETTIRPYDEKISLDMIFQTEKNGGMQQGLQALYEEIQHQVEMRLFPHGDNDIIAFLHDDLYIHEPDWDEKVLQAFKDHPKVGLIGFGGSTGLGGDEIYKDPYEIHQLGRRDFWSNMRGAEVHGQRTTSPMPIVYTDGFSMIVRRSILDAIGGWAWLPPEMVAYAYDYGLACQVRRQGWEALLLPLDVEHGDPKGMGGITRESELHIAMAKKYGGCDHVHEVVHRYIYDTFRDVLPLRLP